MLQLAGKSSNFESAKPKRGGNSSIKKKVQKIVIEDTRLSTDIRAACSTRLKCSRDYGLKALMPRVAMLTIKESDEDEATADLWFERMHEPRLIYSDKYGFSEPLANWLMKQEGLNSEIKLVFSQAGFCINVVQLMLTLSALKPACTVNSSADASSGVDVGSSLALKSASISSSSSSSSSSSTSNKKFYIYAFESDPLVIGVLYFYCLFSFTFFKTYLMI